MLREPPEPGTLLESLMLRVWRARQDIKAQELFLLSQSIMSAAPEGTEVTNVNTAWKDYLELLLPFVKGHRAEMDKKAMDYFKEFSAQGPLCVTPLQPIRKIQSKMRAKK